MAARRTPQVGAKWEQNEQNKVHNRDRRRKEQPIESTSCYVWACLGLSVPPKEFPSMRFGLSTTEPKVTLLISNSHSRTSYNDPAFALSVTRTAG
jgi:hypothetical protein